METVLKVLSEEELSRIHEETLKILTETGVRVDTAKGRKYLIEAGASIDENAHIVRIPRKVVEQSLDLAPKDFNLGSRRPGRSLAMNQGGCDIVLDGGAIYTYDSAAGARRQATREDWYLATRLGDCLDEIEVYWSVVEGCWGHSPPETVMYWKAVLQNFSKHVQDATMSPQESRWMLEVLQVVFGGKERVRKDHPVSFLLCPASPLIIEGEYTDAYLETLGWDIPVAVMTMPLLGISGPVSLISELVLVNCETLAMLCLVQCAEPGTPFIYAAVPAIADMHSGRFSGGEVEHSLLGAAVTELARYYKLPVESSVGGSDQNQPCIYGGYDRAMNYLLPILSQPDLLVAPGLLCGSTVFSPEQLIIDTEIIQRCKRLGAGIGSSAGQWLGEVIRAVGPGGNYLTHRSTRDLIRSQEIYFRKWRVPNGNEPLTKDCSTKMYDEISSHIQDLLSSHKPLPFSEEAERELAKLEKKADICQ